MRTNDTIEENSAKRHNWHSHISREKLGKSMHSVLDGTFLTKKRVIRGLPFVLFLLVLGILYITNIFRVERTKRQLDNLEENLRELRYEYISSQSKLMFESKPSEVSQKLAETGIRESLVPPAKLKVTEEDRIK
jgi:Bacteriodetes cell division protein (FtsL-like)